MDGGVGGGNTNVGRDFEAGVRWAVLDKEWIEVGLSGLSGFLVGTLDAIHFVRPERKVIKLKGLLYMKEARRHGGGLVLLLGRVG